MLGSLGGFVDNSLGTNFFGQNSNDLALGRQTQATDQANQALKNEYQVQMSLMNPNAALGNSAISQLAGNQFMNNWQQDPGYQFQLQQGQNAINSAAAARGMGNSGATLKALAGYNQQMASNAYDKAYDRESNRLNQVAQYGQNANQNLFNASQNYGNQTSANYMGLGNAAAASEIGKGNQQMAFLGGLKDNVSQGMGMAFSDRRLKKNIHRVSAEHLSDLKSELKAFYYEYKDKLHGASGRHIGIIAQDLEKTKLGREIVVENSKGEKMIDMNKVLNLFLATMEAA